jgi:hypothetical protein
VSSSGPADPPYCCERTGHSGCFSGRHRSRELLSTQTRPKAPFPRRWSRRTGIVLGRAGSGAKTVARRRGDGDGVLVLGRHDRRRRAWLEFTGLLHELEGSLVAGRIRASASNASLSVERDYPFLDFVPRCHARDSSKKLKALRPVRH